MRIGHLWFLLAVCGCGGEAGDSPSAVDTSSAGDMSTGFICDRKDRTGTYQVSRTELSGGCGSMGGEIVHFTDGRLPAGTDVSTCSYSQFEYSDSDCRLDFDFTCEYPAMDVVYGAVGFTVSNADGTELTGSEHWEYVGGFGDCTGEYDVVYEWVAD